MPVYVTRTHPPVEYRQTVSVVWSEVVVWAVDVWVTDHRYGSAGVVVSDILHEERCHILEDILAEHGLYQHVMLALFNKLNHSQVVNISIVVKIQVAQWIAWVIQHLLKLLEVSRLTKCSCNNLKIKVIRNLVCLCGYRHSLCSLRHRQV